MTTTAPKHPTLTAARRAAEKAEEVARRRCGELVAAVAARRREVPKSVADALAAYEKADDAAAFAREQISVARVDTYTPDEIRGRRELAHVSALVAAYVLGLELVPQDSPVYPWKIRNQNGKLRDVPNFAGDAAAVTHAEYFIKTEEHRARYADYMRTALGGNEWALATAPAFVRANAMLFAVGINPDDKIPPTWSEVVDHLTR